MQGRFKAWLLPVAVVKLHDGDLHAVGWGEGSMSIGDPIMVGEVVKTKEPNYQKMVNNNLYLDEV